MVADQDMKHFQMMITEPILSLNFFLECVFMMRLKDGKTINFGVMENLLYHLEITK